MNPEYAAARHDRAVKVANRWLKVIKENLMARYKAELRKNFNEHLEVTKNMRALNFSQIQALGTTFKRDFTKKLLVKEVKTDAIMYKALGDVRGQLDEVAHEIYNMQDI